MIMIVTMLRCRPPADTVDHDGVKDLGRKYMHGYGTESGHAHSMATRVLGRYVDQRLDFPLDLPLDLKLVNVAQ